MRTADAVSLVELDGQLQSLVSLGQGRRGVLAAHLNRAHREAEHRPDPAIAVDGLDPGMATVTPRQLDGLLGRPPMPTASSNSCMRTRPVHQTRTTAALGQQQPGVHQCVQSDQQNTGHPSLWLFIYNHTNAGISPARTPSTHIGVLIKAHAGDEPSGRCGPGESQPKAVEHDHRVNDPPSPAQERLRVRESPGQVFRTEDLQLGRDLTELVRYGLSCRWQVAR